MKAMPKLPANLVITFKTLSHPDNIKIESDGKVLHNETYLTWGSNANSAPKAVIKLENAETIIITVTVSSTNTFTNFNGNGDEESTILKSNYRLKVINERNLKIRIPYPTGVNIE